MSGWQTDVIFRQHCMVVILMPVIESLNRRACCKVNAADLCIIRQRVFLCCALLSPASSPA